MDENKLTTIAQIERFLAATPGIEFSGIADAADVERYAHVSRVLKRFDYPARCKRQRGVLHRYLCRTTGYSRAQITRLIARWGSIVLRAFRSRSATALRVQRLFASTRQTILIF